MSKSNLQPNPRNSWQLEQRLQQAIKQQREGKLDSALRKCRSILKKVPDHRETLQLLAILMQQSGNSKSALHFMQKALQTDPDNPHLLKNLAEIYRSRGELESAQQYACAALHHDPQQIDALFISAAVYLQQGDQQMAIDQFSRVIAIKPDDVEARNELGNLLCLEGDLANAIDHYQHALRHYPEFTACRINLADTLVGLGDLDSAIAHYQQVLEAEPYNARGHNQLGQAFAARGDRDKAISCFELALEQDPLQLQARINLGKTMLETDPHQAENWFKSVLDIDPKYVEGYYWLGVLFQSLGKFERASNYLQQASRLDPEYVFAWYRLSLDRRFEPSDKQLNRLEDLCTRRIAAGHSDDDLVSLDFTLGRFHDQRGNHRHAFLYFQHGNRIKAEANPFDKNIHETQIDNVIETFNSEFFAQRNGWGVDSELPIFIIGMPRSGTTLVEQILSAHPDIHAAGELRMMLDLTASLAPGQADEAQSHAGRVAALKQNQVTEIAIQQLQQLHQLAPKTMRITDKLPGNYFRLGLIRLLFPRARIIHCQREPIDTCWSCYQQNFASGLNFSNDLKNLGHAYRGYLRLMAHWHQLFPGQIFDLSYEALVQDPEAVSQSLLNHCGLEWLPQVLDFKNQPRPVNTASLWQVRQPIYQSAIGRWKPYQNYLQPLLQILTDS